MLTLAEQWALAISGALVIFVYGLCGIIKEGCSPMNPALIMVIVSLAIWTVIIKLIMMCMS